MICQGRVVAPVELQDRLCTEALEAKQCRASASSRRSTPPPSLVRESPLSLLRAGDLAEERAVR